MEILTYYLQIFLAIIAGVCGLILIVLGVCYEEVLPIVIGVLGILFPIRMVERILSNFSV